MWYSSSSFQSFCGVIASNLVFLLQKISEIQWDPLETVKYENQSCMFHCRAVRGPHTPAHIYLYFAYTFSALCFRCHIYDGLLPIPSPQIHWDPAGPSPKPVCSGQLLFGREERSWTLTPQTWYFLYYRLCPDSGANRRVRTQHRKA